MKHILLLLLIFTSTTTFAKTLWSDFSLSYLQGNNYEVGDSKRKVLTFEHTTATSWGDSFLFIDHIRSNNDDVETYGEWAPRIKISDFDHQIVKGIYAAGTIEMNTFASADNFGASFTNYLLGVGTDLNIPGFDFFKMNVYYRANEYGDNNYQTTLVWGLPLGPLYYDGFADITSSTDDSSAGMNITSQLKYDVAPHIGLSSKLYLGVEYTYWINKFGIDDLDENNVNLLVKYHF